MYTHIYTFIHYYIYIHIFGCPAKCLLNHFCEGCSFIFNDQIRQMRHDLVIKFTSKTGDLSSHSDFQYF